MFSPHSQQIRHSKLFQRDGPHVHKIDKSCLVAPRKMWPGQCECVQSKKLSNGDKIEIIPNFLSREERISLIQESFAHEKPASNEGGNNNRIEYTRNGKPYAFSPNPHKTIKFPDHCSQLGNKILIEIQKLNETEFTLMDSATEYEYGVDNAEGGFVEKKQDNDGEWGHIAFLGLGQTRYLRITKNNARGFINVPLHDNALVVCSGERFQSNYCHQIDTLPDEHPKAYSLLIKNRFRKPLLSGTKTI